MWRELKAASHYVSLTQTCSGLICSNNSLSNSKACRTNVYMRGRWAAVLCLLTRTWQISSVRGIVHGNRWSNVSVFCSASALVVLEVQAVAQVELPLLSALNILIYALEWTMGLWDFFWNCISPYTVYGLLNWTAQLVFCHWVGASESLVLWLCN